MHDLKLWGPDGSLKATTYVPSGSIGARIAPSTYSIRQEFDGAHVLLTGSSGYIGSVVLEQLLRCTNVASVRCLMRDKKDELAEKRIAKVMQGSLFHKVRENQKLLKKVSVVKGDILLPNLGLNAADTEAVVNEVDMIIHCAADIRLEACIQETLLANFEGTRSILNLALSLRHLRSLVHVSSAYVNMNFPRSSIVHEQVYPLKHGEQEIDAEELARELMSLPKHDANSRAKVYTSRWHFPNNYTMGKHLAEQLVARYQARHQLPVVIVRPSLVCAIAGEPYPGYAGNWAGPIGAGAAMAIGLFDCLGSVASKPLHVWDCVPADQVASIILAASAAAAAGVTPEISFATGAGSIAPNMKEAVAGPTSLAVFLPSASPITSGGSSGKADTAAAVGGAGAVPPVARAPSTVVHCEIVGKPAVVSAGEKGGLLSKGCMTDECVMTEDSLSEVASACGPVFSSSPERSPPLSPTTVSPGAPVLTPQLLAAATQQHQHHHHQHRAPLQLRPLLIVHAATSSTYPLTLLEGWNYNLQFFAAHPPAFSITWGKLPQMPPEFEPEEAAVLRCRAWTGWKVWAITNLLKMAGKDKQAKKLSVGFETFCVHNNAKTDRDLMFSTHGLCGLADRLDPAEADDFLLVWRPRSGESHQGHLAAIKGPISWRRYVHTQMAGIYRMVFGVSVPVEGHAPLVTGQEEPSAEQLVFHDFKAIK